VTYLGEELRLCGKMHVALFATEDGLVVEVLDENSAHCFLNFRVIRLRKY